MPNYAIVDNNKIINVIIADSKEIAEQATGMTVIETEGIPWIDWTLEEDGWRSPKLFSSWIWKDSKWQPPIPKPTNPFYTYNWNEEKQEWDEKEFPQPYPSWTKNNNGEWISPIPYPQDEKNIYNWNEEKQEWEREF